MRRIKATISFFQGTTICASSTIVTPKMLQAFLKNDENAWNLEGAIPESPQQTGSVVSHALQIDLRSLNLIWQDWNSEEYSKGQSEFNDYQLWLSAQGTTYDDEVANAEVKHRKPDRAERRHLNPTGD